jgi:hypothetical protein
MGTVMKERVKFRRRPLSPTAIEDQWLQRATAVAIEHARKAVTDGEVPPNTPIGRLSDTEWGWIVAAVLFGWIETRAEQAIKSSVGVDAHGRAEGYVRDINLDPDPWDVGAIAAILPELASASPVSEMRFKPFYDLSRDEMLAFLSDAFSLIRKAMVARDQGQNLVTQHTPSGSPPDPNDTLVGLPFSEKP